MVQMVLRPLSIGPFQQLSSLFIVIFLLPVARVLR